MLQGDSAVRKLHIGLIYIYILTIFIPGLTIAENVEIYEVGIKEEVILALKDDIQDLIVSDSEVISVDSLSNTKVIVYGLALGESLLIGTDFQGEQVYLGKVIVRYPVDSIKQVLNQRFPGNDIIMFASEGTLLIQGTVDSHEMIENVTQTVKPFIGDGTIINQLEANTPKKVRLYVRLVELSRSVEEAFGVNWQTMIGGGASETGGGISLLSGSVPNTALEATAGTTLGLTARSAEVDINAAIDWLEKKEYASVLTEPNISTISGQSATFEVGRQIPIPSPTTADTSGGVSYQFFGLSLEFTPEVIDKQRLKLELKINSNDSSGGGASSVDGNELPISSSQKFDTVFELRDGESFAIAGLFQKVTGDTVNELPGLAAMPVLGDFFKRKTHRDNQSELIVVVTPYLLYEERYIDDVTISLRPLTNIEYIMLSKSGRENILYKKDMFRMHGSAGFSY